MIVRMWHGRVDITHSITLAFWESLDAIRAYFIRVM